MVNINTKCFQSSGDFGFAVAAVRIRLHTHEAAGPVLRPAGQGLDVFLLDFRKPAQLVPQPAILDPVFVQDLFQAVFVECRLSAVRLGAHIQKVGDAVLLEDMDQFIGRL